MAQTGTAEGHAHTFIPGDKFTSMFEQHRHEIPASGTRTGRAINLLTEELDGSGHRHDIPGRV